MSDIDAIGPQAVLDEAFRLRDSRDPATALQVFFDLTAGRHGELRPDQAQLTYRYGFKVLLNMGDWSGLEGVARDAIEQFPDLWQAHHHLAAALIRQGREDEALAPLSRAIMLAPDKADPRNLLRMLGEKAERRRSRPVRIWPRRVQLFKDVQDVIERFLLKDAPDARFIRPDTQFVALGSCFAGNFARRLAATGRPTHYEAIGEDVNSTFANRYLLQWLEHGPTDATTSDMERTYGPKMRGRLRNAISRADVLVLTVGVAACFFHRDTGAFTFVAGMLSATARELLLRQCDMRTTTVAENAENIEAILDSIRRLSSGRARVVITLSPVPLQATNEHHSAVIADCLSKATLRLACQDVLSRRDPTEITYWPSFEIVRWLGVHFGAEHPLVYGDDDGSTLHVSQWLVDIIIELFLRHHSIDGGAAPSTGAPAQ